MQRVLVHLLTKVNAREHGVHVPEHGVRSWNFVHSARDDANRARLLRRASLASREPQQLLSATDFVSLRATSLDQLRLLASVHPTPDVAFRFQVWLWSLLVCDVIPFCSQVSTSYQTGQLDLTSRCLHRSGETCHSVTSLRAACGGETEQKISPSSPSDRKHTRCAR